jgi:mannose-6-phosphate isomerase
MQNTKKIFRLTGIPQHYSWGGDSFIPELLHVPNNDKKPFAEYWMGAHLKAPSIVVYENGRDQDLNAFIASDPVSMLGAKVNARFGRLPYLFKVLDVKDMLSIQVHPSKKSAELEFEKENKKGIPLDAAYRNYKDDNHKPELMVALSDFWLLHGFKESSKLEAVLSKTSELQFLLPIFKESGYEGLYKKVMELDQQEVNKRLQSLLHRIIPLYKEEKLSKTDEDFWAARAAITFNEAGNIDRGIFSVYLFNLVNLKPGEAIFQDAGVPHAYLEGQNMELMANSDNVLRGGLTNKHIDVAELIKHVKPEATIPNIIKGRDSGVVGEKLFLTPATDFELRQITLQKGDETTLLSVTAEIFFVYEGEVEVSEGQNALRFGNGESFLVANGGSVKLKALSACNIFRATVPQG